jgi:hydroxymethylglutaryl-CoA lyase
MTNPLKIVECPRDAWQSLPFQIPSEVKAQYLRKLFAAGFKHIDAVSFVSPTAVPQMADSEKVLEALDPPETVEIIAIVVNEKGAERAIATGKVSTIGFPYSISPEFLKRNQNQTPEQSLDVLEAVATQAYDASVGLAVYISMAFGNPYGDAWSIDEVVDACSLLSDLGVEQVSLADTVGLATAPEIAEVFAAVRTAHPGLELGVHLHARPDDAAAKIRAAYHAGCRRFDAAIGGLGGCPFAQDLLVGNIPTETLVEELRNLGAELPWLASLDNLVDDSAELARRYGTKTQ